MTRSVLGYDGQRTDPATGWLHLGNGYRAYHPDLMRFTTPDSLSPFGAGGINPYAYCLGDPVNRTDPTGHLLAAPHGDQDDEPIPRRPADRWESWSGKVEQTPSSGKVGPAAAGAHR
ncbi:RHS repeat-associated core domain-containing protein [Streptomyces sp. NPDC047917]|uniref:RHS repeat-associated core domain-containing protein n=1 Tax=Streptomyces sp. NPDC047917 TaxID=3365491 RepID=UPI003724ABF0